MNEKKLFIDILYFYKLISIKSNHIYKTILEPLLEEESHSFGFKPFAKLNNYIITELESIYHLDYISEFILDKELYIYINDENERTKITKPADLFTFIVSNNNTDNTEKLFLLITNIITQLSIIEKKIGKLYKPYVTNPESNEDIFFQPAFKLIQEICNIIDTTHFSKINGYNNLSKNEIEDIEKEYGGLFYNYSFFSSYGKEKCNLVINNKTITINSFNHLLEEFKKYNN